MPLRRYGLRYKDAAVAEREPTVGDVGLRYLLRP